jgi:dipeptidyl aminopeptidase/acylaminoacyl peptidase
VQTLADVPIVVGGTSGAWNRDGVILFAPANTVPLSRVIAGRGAPVPTTRLDPPQAGHRYPNFLPDGRRFLFFALGPPQAKGVYAGSIDSPDVRRLFDADSAAVFAAPDLAIFAREGALLAQRLDLDTLTLVGDPLPVAGSVAVHPNVIGAVAVSASATGPLAYRAAAEERQLTWVDRAGRRTGLVGAPDSGQPLSPELSPDERTVALARMMGGRPDLWLVDGTRGGLQRFTADWAQEYDPTWSPDGSRIIFSSNRTGILDLYEKSVGGGGTGDTLLLRSGEHKNALHWSPDGRYFLYAIQTAVAGRDIWCLPLTGDRKPFAVVQTMFEETEARFSPDGRWIAYQSNESGRTEVYVQRFPEPGSRFQISTAGGRFPQWRRDGRELFYLGGDDRLMAVRIDTSGSALESSLPETLFSAPAGAEYVASPDGQRFLVNVITREPSPITVLLNWRPR